MSAARMSYQLRAKRTVKAEMAKRGVTYRTLAKRMNLSAPALKTRIERGTFSMAFFLRCMDALQVEFIDFVPAELVADEKR